MWSYKKEEKGYRLYANTEPINFTVLIPFKSCWDGDNQTIIVYWTEDKIKKLVNGLNNGEIPISFKMSKEGIVFTTKLLKEFY